MARPPNADPEATKARILEAATQLFATQGRAGTGLREIAAHAGVSQSLVSHYFGGKDRLYRAVLRGVIERLRSLVSGFVGEVTQGAPDPRSVLERAVRVGFRFARANKSAVLLLQRSLFETGALDVETRRRSVVPFLAQSSQIVAALTGRSAEALRLPIQSVVFLVTRYAIAGKADLAAVVGAPARAPEAEILSAIEEHLVAASLSLLFEG